MTTTDNNAGAPQDLAALKLADLRKIAAGQGLKGISGLRKGELITAIQTGTVPAKAKKAAAEAAAAEGATSDSASGNTAEPQGEDTKKASRRRATRRSADDTQSGEQSANQDPQDGQQESARENGQGDDGRAESRSQARRARRNRARAQARDERENRDDEAQGSGDNRRGDHHADGGDNGPGRDGDSDDRSRESQRDGDGEQQGNRNDRHDRNDRNRGRGDNRGDNNERRGRRNRRNRRNRGNNEGGRNNGGNNSEPQVREGDELQAVGGILDIVDHNAAFVRTTGYRAGASDVFVNNNMVRRLGLRDGDAITGQVKMNGNAHTHGNGRNRRKYNQLVQVDSVNGLTPEEAKQRPEFAKLTPLYPNQRLRLETEPKILTTRVIDLIMPIGKGQRALIVSPPKAGKTTILQNIANAISTNNPECYLMVVLVDERPEEVTDMQRSVKGEVIASTFDRPPSEHTAVAELAIERAKRLVEQGKDVVVLLDSITRLGRAYNNSSPASGRILSGGVDSNALYPPKRFLGAARNIENGGSLTIIATAMVETGSTGDTVIFEEFKGTGNAELKLDRSISERRIFPAVDVSPSGTRKDELLLVPEEAKIMLKLRRILSRLDSHQAIDLLIKQLKKTKSNGEFLMQLASSAPMAGLEDEEEYS
ncbi:transcription termination factor Rho [Corynebacterium incognita]|uniref:Transcription termination factor Rho n=1 Tax=Corynebacterium incognita TaxID=2754725 RepID=A0A7G7CP67_9CORY|nr:transcription termination factor Rho [Corynebacterium incognita]QNE89383.1 transcription termination factor Rho [Corynebacterium incognita]